MTHLRVGLGVESDGMPSYPQALALNPDDVLNIRVTRDSETSLHTIPLAGQSTPVPQWRKPVDG
jgi:hypothetical protein